MWTCKHCKVKMDLHTTAEKANHSRWCDENPNRNTWKNSGNITVKKLWGEWKEYTVTCESCSVSFQVRERENLHPRKSKYYCSRRCACSVGGNAGAKKHHNDSKAHYRTVAFRHRDKWCYACGHDRILEVHHTDGNHKNNDPKNLIPLCSTHHRMIHSRWRHEVEELLKEGKFLGK